MRTNLLLLAGTLLIIAMLFVMWKDEREKDKALEERLRGLAGASGAKKEKTGMKLALLMKRTECQAALVVAIAALAASWFMKLGIMAGLFLVMLTSGAAWVMVHRWRLDQARKAFLARFPEAIDNFARSIQAGIPVDRALKIVGETYDDEFGRRITKLCQEMEVGLPFREALHNFADAIDNADVDFFCEVLALNRETGSALSPMLASLSMMLRERRSVDRKLKSLTAESRASARVLCLLPVFILGLQAFLNPSQVLFLANDPTGRVVAGYCLASMLVGFIIIQRMSRSLNG